MSEEKTNNIKDLDLEKTEKNKTENKDFSEDDYLSMEDILLPPEEIEETEEEEELPGDENIHSILMPDGSFNYKFLDSLDALVPSDLEEVSIPFSQFPEAIKNNITLKLVVGVAIIIILILFYASGWVADARIFIMLIFPAMMFLSAFLRYRMCKRDQIVKFEGTVITADTYGFVKATKYQVIKISNDEKFLNIKTPINKTVYPGMPITVYLNKNTPIIDSQYGPLAEHYVSYTFNVTSEEDEEELKKGDVSADDYINN